MWTKTLALLLGLAAVAVAQSKSAPDGPVADGAFAHPLHWSDPNGTAAGTRRSRCTPITNDVMEAWQIELPGPAASPIVYWEREAYLVCEKKDRFVLVAIDVVRGKLVARKELPKGPRPVPVVWDGRVFLRVGDFGIGEYRRVGRTLNRVWVHKPGKRYVSDPIVFDNEIYVVADGRLTRLRPRRKSPVWQAGEYSLRGRPALYGDHVYVLGDMQETGFAISMHLFVYDRRSGRQVSVANAAWYARRDPPHEDQSGQITVTEKEIHIRGPAPLATKKGSATHVMLSREMTKRGLFIATEAPSLMSMPVPPSHTPLGVLALVSGRKMGWLINKGAVGLYLSQKKYNPDLYNPKVRVAATVLGDIVYFGSWAADIRTSRVLWRLPVTSLKYPAVPLDGMVLVIDEQTQLRAFRARGMNE